MPPHIRMPEAFSMTTQQAWAMGSEPENREAAGHKGMVFQNSEGRRAIVTASGAFCFYADASQTTRIVVPCYRSTSWRVYREPEPPEPEIIEVTVGKVLCEAWPIVEPNISEPPIRWYHAPGHRDDAQPMGCVWQEPGLRGFAFKRDGMPIVTERDVLATLIGFRDISGFMSAVCASSDESVPPTHVLIERKKRCDTD